VKRLSDSPVYFHPIDRWMRKLAEARGEPPPDQDPDLPRLFSCFVLEGGEHDAESFISGSPEPDYTEVTLEHEVGWLSDPNFCGVAVCADERHIQQGVIFHVAALRERHHQP
jgi:hypothetical protein